MTDQQPPAWYLEITKRAHEEAPTVPAATVTATDSTEYTVNCLPEDHINSSAYQLRVQPRGDGRYAVIRGSDMCLGADGTWDHDLEEYDRGDDWLGAHRFDLDTALRLAKEHAPLVTVNCQTVSDVLGKREKKAGRDG